MWGSLLQFLVASLLVVVAAAWGSRALGRWLRPARPGELEVRSYLPLGGRRAVCLVRWGDEDLLIGVTDQDIRLLARRPGSSGGAAP